MFETASTELACELAEPESVRPPQALVKDNGRVVGLTDGGELIVLQSHVSGVGDALSTLDPATDTITSVVSRQPPRSQEAATSQITGNTIGNESWIVWEESGFSLEHADWTMWAQDRTSGKVRQVASWDRGASGEAPPGFASRLSLRGDLAAWSAPVELPTGGVGQRVYVADLRSATVTRFDDEARLPSVVATDILIEALRTGTDPLSGKVLAQPAIVDPANGRAYPEDWVPPERMLDFAAGPAGTVIAHLLREATETDASTTVEVQTRDRSAVVRTFPLETDWGPVAAGDLFLAWADQRHVWVLPSRQSTPELVLTAAADSEQVQLYAAADTILWRPVGFDFTWDTVRLAHISCP